MTRGGAGEGDEPRDEYVELAGRRFEQGEERFETGAESTHEAAESAGTELSEDLELGLRPDFGGDPDGLGGAATLAQGETLVVDARSAGAPVGHRVPTWRQMLQVFVANKLAVISVVLLILIVLLCFLGPHFYVSNQTDANVVLGQPPNLPPDSTYLLGTDSQGYDVFGRIMYAGQFSLTIGLLAGLITILMGTMYGLVSGYFGGAADTVMMRILDAFLSIPYLFLLVALIAIYGQSTVFVMLVIGLTGWWGSSRIIRGNAMTIRDLEYSQAARTMGAKGWHVIRRHIFPNTISTIVTVGTFAIADSILALSALGFIGLGLKSPAVDWGTMLYGGTSQLVNGYWWEIWPVAFIFVLVIICLNFIGDALRDVFEVRLRER